MRNADPSASAIHQYLLLPLLCILCLLSVTISRAYGQAAGSEAPAFDFADGASVQPIGALTSSDTGVILAEGRYAAAESLFNSGLNATAIISGANIRVPAARFPCASCHGSDGLGRQEGGTHIPAITGRILTVGTSTRPAYNIDSFLDAVREGVSPDGRSLSQIMPGFDADEETLRDLFDYLHELDKLQRAGITTTTIAFRAPRDEDTQLGFVAAMENFNRQGGSYGRKIVLVQDNEDYLLSIDSVFDALDSEVMSAQQSRLLSEAKADGVVQIDVVPQYNSDTLRLLLDPFGMSYSANAPVLYMSSADSRATVSDASFATGKTDSSDIQALAESRKQRIYAAIWPAGRTPGAWMDSGRELVIAGFDEQALQWALSQGLSARASRGYALARLLFDAVLASARDMTRSELLRIIETLDLKPRVFVVRSSKD